MHWRRFLDRSQRPTAAEMAVRMLATVAAIHGRGSGRANERRIEDIQHVCGHIRQMRAR
jgi:hypothetical protein